MVFTAISRLMGFVRLAVVAAVFGAGGQADVFHAVFQVPNNLRRLLAEGAFSASIVPALSRESSPQEQSALVRSALALQVAVTVPIIIILVIASGPVTGFLFRFQDPVKIQSTLSLFRVMIPYAVLAGAGAVLMGALHVRGIFVVPAVAPLLFSVGVIASILILSPSIGIYATAIGVGIGGVLQLLVQVPSFLKNGFSLVPYFRFDHRLRRILRGWGPAVLSALVFAVVQQVAMLIASSLGNRSTSAIGYAVVFFQLPLGVLSVSIVTAAFPKMASLAADGRVEEMRSYVADGMVTVVALLVPSALIYIFLAEDIIKALLEHGRFDQHATKLTASVLRGFALGLPSVGLFTYLQRLCYALDYPGRALGASIAVGIIDITLSIWWTQMSFGVVGLALANSVAFTVGVIILAIPSRQVSSKTIAIGAKKIAAGTVPAVIILWSASSLLMPVARVSTTVGHITLLIVVVIAVIATTVLIYYVVGVPFIRRTLRFLARKGQQRPS